MNGTTLKTSQVEINLTNSKKAQLIFRALNHGLRLKMIKTIDQTPNITVTDLYIILRLEQSVASQHLAILRKAGIVTTSRDGKFIHYNVNYDRLTLINNKAAELSA